MLIETGKPSHCRIRRTTARPNVGNINQACVQVLGLEYVRCMRKATYWRVRICLPARHTGHFLHLCHHTRMMRLCQALYPQVILLTLTSLIATTKNGWLEIQSFATLRSRYIPYVWRSFITFTSHSYLSKESVLSFCGEERCGSSFIECSNCLFLLQCWMSWVWKLKWKHLVRRWR